VPESNPPARPYPGKHHRLKDGAAIGQLVTVRCSLCRRAATYLAADLATLLDPVRDASEPPFTCSKCGRTDYLRVTLRLPEAGDWGSLPVRRPGPVKVTQTWRTVKLVD
jgi:hypothetical protein